MLLFIVNPFSSLARWHEEVWRHYLLSALQPRVLGGWHPHQRSRIPDRVLIGGEDPRAIEDLTAIYGKWGPAERIVHCPISGAANYPSSPPILFWPSASARSKSIAALWEATAADVQYVARAMGSDSRLGAKFLKAGPGLAVASSLRSSSSLCTCAATTQG